MFKATRLTPSSEGKFGSGRKPLLLLKTFRPNLGDSFGISLGFTFPPVIITVASLVLDVNALRVLKVGGQVFASS